MKTKITDTRKITSIETGVRDGYLGADGTPREDTEATFDARHTDTRKVFIYFEDGDAADWEKKRHVYGSSYSTKSREVTDTWRPQWVAASWSKRSDQDTWVAESAKLKSYNVKKNGEVGQREEDTYLWSAKDREKLPLAAAKFIEEHAPGVFPFFKDKEDVNA